MTDMIFSQFLPISCAAVISSFPQSLILSLSFVGLCDNFEFGIGGGHQEKKNKRRTRRGGNSLYVFCIVVVLFSAKWLSSVFSAETQDFSEEQDNETNDLDTHSTVFSSNPSPFTR